MLKDEDKTFFLMKKVDFTGSSGVVFSVGQIHHICSTFMPWLMDTASSKKGTYLFIQKNKFWSLRKEVGGQGVRNEDTLSCNT